MSSAYVDDAAAFAKGLTLDETGRAGDYGRSMRRLARKVGVGFSVLKNLHYDLPKRVDAAVFEKLGTAYGARRLHEKDRYGYIPRTAFGRMLVGVADTLDRVADSLDRPEAGAVD